MRAMGLVGTACLVLVVTAAAGAAEEAKDKPRDLIVGKWQPAKEDKQEMTLEFKKDGTLKVEVKKPGIALDGKYKFTKDDELEVEMTFMGETKKETMTVKVTNEELTTKDSKGKEETFKKVK
jgi:uncharacterized protein (TIGR03066 family)